MQLVLDTYVVTKLLSNNYYNILILNIVNHYLIVNGVINLSYNPWRN